MKMNKNQTVFVLGCSSLALGIAHSLPENTIVTESTCFAGREFLDSLHPNIIFSTNEWTGDTKTLINTFEKRNILTNGRFQTSAAAPLFFEMIKNERLKVLFIHFLTGVNKNTDGFDITLHSISGFETIHTSIIIDTTSTGESIDGALPEPKNKKINALLTAKNPQVPLPVFDTACVQSFPGFFPGEACLSYDLDTGDDWIAARKKLLEYWRSHKDLWKGWKMASIASSFVIEPPCTNRELGLYWWWYPSAIYRNVLEAYDAGIHLGHKLGALCG